MQVDRPPFKVAALGLIALVAAGASTAPAESPDGGAATVLSCEPFANHALPLGRLHNNQWNRAAAGKGPWRQCLQSREREGRTEYGWLWQWPSHDDIYAYPEIMLGRSPWADTPTDDARFPRRLADTRSLRVDYEVESNHSGKHNVALEFWFTKSELAPKPDPHSIRTELMIWSDASEGMVSKKDVPEARISIDGNEWDVYVKRDWGVDPAITPLKWTFLTYVATRPMASVRYDARRFFDDALARGLVSESDTIAGVELGTEISSGSGSFWLKRFQVEVE